MIRIDIITQPFFHRSFMLRIFIKVVILFLPTPYNIYVDVLPIGFRRNTRISKSPTLWVMATPTKFYVVDV